MAQQPITLWVGPHPHQTQADTVDDAVTDVDALSPARTQVHTPSLPGAIDLGPSLAPGKAVNEPRQGV